MSNSVSLLIALDKEVSNEETKYDQENIGHREYRNKVGRAEIHHVGERLQVIFLCDIGYVSNVEFWDVVAEHVYIGLRSRSLKSLDDEVEDSNSGYQIQPSVSENLHVLWGTNNPPSPLTAS